MAASEGFIPYIADPLGHSGLIMESKTFDKMDGKNSLSVIVSPKNNFNFSCTIYSKQYTFVPFKTIGS